MHISYENAFDYDPNAARRRRAAWKAAHQLTKKHAGRLRIVSLARR